MTAEEARERVCEVRVATNRLMRALSIPVPEWERASMEAADAWSALQALVHELNIEAWKARRAAWLNAKKEDPSSCSC